MIKTINTVINPATEEKENTVFNTLVTETLYNAIKRGETARANNEVITSIALAWQECKNEIVKEELYELFYALTRKYFKALLTKKIKCNADLAGRIDTAEMESYCVKYAVDKSLSWYKVEKSDNVFSVAGYALSQGVKLFILRETNEKTNRGMRGVCSLDTALTDEAGNEDLYEKIKAGATLTAVDDLGESITDETMLTPSSLNTGVGMAVSNIVELVKNKFGAEGVHILKAQALVSTQRADYYMRNLQLEEYGQTTRKRISRQWKKIQEYCLMNKELILAG